MRGSVRQKGEGRWQVRISLGRDPVSGRYRTIAREVRGRKRDAELLAAKLVAEVERGAYRDQEVSRHGVADLLEDWMASVGATEGDPLSRPRPAAPARPGMPRRPRGPRQPHLRGGHYRCPPRRVVRAALGRPGPGRSFDDYQPVYLRRRACRGSEGH